MAKIKAENILAEAQTKADALSLKQGKKVYPIIVTVPDGEPAIGFIQEPTRQAKMAALDTLASENAATLSGKMIFDASFLPNESDKRFISNDSEHDAIVIGAYVKCNEFIRAYSTEIKKK